MAAFKHIRIVSAFVIVLAAALTRIAHADTYTVTNTEDDGPGSLRQAIVDANNHAGADTIAFNIWGGGAWTLSPLTSLPTLTGPTTVDGTTQPGYMGAPIIELDGSFVDTSDTDGLRVESGGCAIRGLVINRWGRSGITVSGVTGAIVTGCWIGLDTTGSMPLGCTNGIYLHNSSGCSVQNCVVSGNIVGIHVDSASATNTIQSCYIGLDASGTNPLGMQTGVLFEGVGASVPTSNTLSSCVLAGNDASAVFITGGASSTTISGNLIGVNRFYEPVGNGGYGIGISGGSNNLAASNTIYGSDGPGIRLTGGTVGPRLEGNTILANFSGVDLRGGTQSCVIGGATAAQGNVIDGNYVDGILISEAGTNGNTIQSNDIHANNACGVYVQTTLNAILANTIHENALDGVCVGPSATRVTIRANSLYDNGDLGIRLMGYGDNGGNNLLSAPSLSLVMTDDSATYVIGTYYAAANQTYALEFFASDEADPSGLGEGKRYLGTTNVTTDSGGAASVQVMLPPTVAGQVLSATATGPDGSTSDFSVAVQIVSGSPAAKLTSLSPASKTVGAAAFTLTVNGSGFVSGAVVRWNGADRTTTFVSATQLTASIPATDMAAAMVAKVAAALPNGTVSNALDFTINNPVPTLSSISPTSTTAGGTGFTLTATGSNFVQGSTIQWNGENRATTFVSSTSLTMAVSAADIADGATVTITVVNPTPGGGTSAAKTLTVKNATPSITTLTPATTAAGGPDFILTLDGSKFVPSSVVQWNGAARTTTFVSSTRVQALIYAADIATAGTASVTVFNPAPVGGTSTAKTFTVGNPVPAIASLEPAQVLAGSAGFTLTVNGAGFVPGSVVRWNGTDRTTTYVSATKLTAPIDAADVLVAGYASVKVFNPTPGGGSSDPASFAVTNPVPTLSSVSPNDFLAGSAGFTMTVTGANFVTGSQVRWNGAARATTYVSSTQLTAAIPASDLASAGTANISVANPLPGGGYSADVPVTVRNPVPTITGLSPAQAFAGSSAITVSVLGTGFASNSVIRWNGADRVTTYMSATELRTRLARADLATPGTANVTVFTGLPGGGVSNTATFTVSSLPQIIVASATATRGTNVSVTFTLRNVGSGTAVGVKIKYAKLGGIATNNSPALPMTIPDIAAGATSAPITLTFPTTVTAGSRVLAITLTASGQSLSASRLVTVP